LHAGGKKYSEIKAFVDTSSLICKIFDEMVTNFDINNPDGSIDIFNYYIPDPVLKLDY